MNWIFLIVAFVQLITALVSRWVDGGADSIYYTTSAIFWVLVAIYYQLKETKKEN